MMNVPIESVSLGCSIACAFTRKGATLAIAMAANAVTTLSGARDFIVTVDLPGLFFAEHKRTSGLRYPSAARVFHVLPSGEVR